MYAIAIGESVLHSDLFCLLPRIHHMRTSHRTALTTSTQHTLLLPTAAHTLDVEQRSGKKDRSQTFKWFAAPLIYYLCDYATMWFNQR